MYDDFKVTNYSKALVSPELYARHFSRTYTGDVIDGFTVTPGTGLQVVLAAGNTLIRYGSGAVASARFVSLVNTFNLTIGTADVSNPRIDLVVVYVDNAVSLPSGTPTSANLDGKGVAKAKIVAGTPNASPTAPNSTAIQSSVGAGNPYTVVAEVRVDAGVSVIASNKITDVRSMARLTADKLDFATFPRFRAKRVAAANVTTSLSLVTMDSVDYNIGSAYNPANGRFTAPVTGYYHFDAALGVMASTHVLISLFKNGAEIARGTRILGVSSSNIDAAMGTDLYLLAGDYVQPYGIASGTNAIAVADPTTYFNGHLIALA
jgi:hypothetical protein